MSKTRLLAALISPWLLTLTAGAQPTIQALFEGLIALNATRVSAEGRTVAGSLRDHPAVWSRRDGFRTLSNQIGATYDFNADGFVDYLDFVQAFEIGC